MKFIFIPSEKGTMYVSVPRKSIKRRIHDVFLETRSFFMIALITTAIA